MSLKVVLLTYTAPSLILGSLHTTSILANVLSSFMTFSLLHRTFFPCHNCLKTAYLEMHLK